MLFNSYVFILAFFPLAMILYFGINRLGKYRTAQLVLILLSLIFYAYFNVWYLGILFGSILLNWLFSRLIIRSGNKMVLITGISLNIAVIFVFKYFNFFAENINGIFGARIPFLNILMPLGISFFTFQQISYLVDSYKQETVDYSFCEYALFVSFFPQLIAGPIVLHQEMIPQIKDETLKRFNHDNFSKGIYMFSVGLAKKVLLADTLSRGVDWGYAHITSMGSLNMLLVAVLYSFQLYFDFSGYCDMACGIALCFNFQLPVNFLSPYKSGSIGEFWKRWHITLTRFLTKYIYIPLGGSRNGKCKTVINVLIVFFVSGLWHGANWTFVAWGLLHGLAMVGYRLNQKLWDKIPKLVRVAATFMFVTLAWIPFRATNLFETFEVFKTIFTKHDFSLQQGFIDSFNILEFTYLEDHVGLLRMLLAQLPSIHVWLLVMLSFSIVFFGHNCHEKKFSPGVINALKTVILLIWCILSLASVSTFLYFNF